MPTLTKITETWIRIRRFNTLRVSGAKHTPRYVLHLKQKVPNTPLGSPELDVRYGPAERHTFDVFRRGR
jgi:hypothetical protein